MDHGDAATITTLGELKEKYTRPGSVKDELRRNLLSMLKSGQTVFPGIVGFEHTVIPEIQNAILSRHNLILLGLRGQAKTKIIRMLLNLLDPAIPVIAGSEVNDDPYAPISKHGRDLVDKMGDDAPIEWITRDQRYGEKLATPDTSIADLIGDIDPIKAASRRLTYGDEEVIHFGLIPRTNRGIFAINELPDLPARIQVGLLNIMEEQDIQIRGFNVRFPLDLMMVFTANPEDYTNRGNIITPLKDRIDSQVVTHYPQSLSDGVAITTQEAWQQRGAEAATVHVPRFLLEIIEQVAFEARTSEYVDQKSGVSARMTRSALEMVISNCERRIHAEGTSQVTARITDLESMVPAITGKVELVYEGEQEGVLKVARVLIGRAVRSISSRYFPDPADKRGGRESYAKILQWFAAGHNVMLPLDIPDRAYEKRLAQIGGLRPFMKRYAGSTAPSDYGAMAGFVLESLHQHSLLGKELETGTSATYTDLMGSMLSSIRTPEDDDEADH